MSSVLGILIVPVSHVPAAIACCQLTTVVHCKAIADYFEDAGKVMGIEQLPAQSQEELGYRVRFALPSEAIAALEIDETVGYLVHDGRNVAGFCDNTASTGI